MIDAISFILIGMFFIFGGIYVSWDFYTNSLLNRKEFTSDMIPMIAYLIIWILITACVGFIFLDIGLTDYNLFRS
jgi:H+/Cl- antiporter ClcA